MPLEDAKISFAAKISVGLIIYNFCHPKKLFSETPTNLLIQGAKRYWAYTPIPRRYRQGLDDDRNVSSIHQALAQSVSYRNRAGLEEDKTRVEGAPERGGIKLVAPEDIAKGSVIIAEAPIAFCFFKSHRQPTLQLLLDIFEY